MAATAAAPSSQVAMAITPRRRKGCRDQFFARRHQVQSTITCSAVGGINRFAKTPEEEGLGTLLDRMKETLHQTDSATYARILRVCGKFKSLQEGKRVHSYIRESGQEQDRILGNHLVEMYLKCGSLRDAQRMFDEMTSRDAVLWTSMITAYSDRGHFRAALKLFQKMQADESVTPDNVTFLTVLNCCGRTGALEEGKLIHSQLSGNGFENDVIVKTALLNMYGKCGSLKDARQVFETIEAKDIVSWNSMLSVYVQHGEYQEALELYRKLDLAPTVSTFVTLLNACAGAAALEDGREFHSCITERGLESDDSVSGALFNMYGKCGSLEEAHSVFLQRRHHDNAAWAYMMSFYNQNDRSREALRLFRIMQQEGVRVDKFAFTTSLSACNGAEDLSIGKRLHAWIQESGFDSDVVVRSSLIHMYGRCGSYQDAWELFQKIPSKNVLLCSSMIATCGKHGHWKEMLEIFKRVQSIPYKLTIVDVLKACAELKALEDGRAIHKQIKGKDLYLDAGVRESLVTMYCKCGDLEEARMIFDGTREKCVGLWNSIIAAYIQDGQVKQALELFEQMQVEDVEPNEATIASILLVDEGYQFLKSTPKDARIAELCEEAGVRDERLQAAPALTTTASVLS